ncbi:hypothetical protein ABIC83_002771 [Roseateles asaccharophilus]|uniref:hypothetical protein n=1 Tax=Roseateles asaccharophilus TaxID=582607 RepID=UPI003838978D
MAAQAQEHVTAGRGDELTPRPGQEYGTQYSCINCDSEHNEICGLVLRPRTEPTHWWMGLMQDANAYYFCDDCKGLGIDVRPSFPLGYRG